LLLAFDSFVLAAALGRDIAIGKIIHGDDHARIKVKTSALADEVRKRLGKITALLSSPTSPDLILNRHCAECEFQAQCRKEAIAKDDLSLLSGMSATERGTLHSKGIFTVTQLSYTFRPRRRPKRQREKREKYHHSLKALAIRKKKIHIVGSPELKIEGTPVYLDVEGMPDRAFYYLIGVRIGNDDSAVQHSLWADTVEDEGKIWREFLAILETVEKPVLIYYGSYESTFLKRMTERHTNEVGNDAFLQKVAKEAVNLLAHIYGQVYFLTYSNGLKAVAGFIGFSWSASDSTGQNSIIWRHQWEGSRAPALREKLLAYNVADCEACEVLCKVLNRLPSRSRLGDCATKQDVAVVIEDLPSAFSHPDWGTFSGTIPELNIINEAAQWDYQRDRIYLRNGKHPKEKVSKNQAKKRRATGKVDRVVSFPTSQVCPKCHRKSNHEAGTESHMTSFIYSVSFGANYPIVFKNHPGKRDLS